MRSLGIIALSAPAMLAGLAMLAWPLVAHWMNRGARRRLVFPSVRLLAPTRSDHTRLHRPRRWLLLLLRSLAVALLVLMFAQPVWRNPAPAGAAPDQPAAVVLLADVSASMAQRTDGVPAMSALRAAAARILRELATGQDRANLVLAGGRAEPQFPTLTANLPAVLKALEDIAPTVARADLEGALAVAGRQLATHGGARHLVILTDRQRTNWDALERQAAALPPDVHIACVPVDGQPPANVSLSDPCLTPAMPAAGQSVSLTVRVTRHGGGTATVPVTCRVEHQAPMEQPLALSPGESREATFPLRCDSVGFHRVTVEIPEDGLPADNHLYCVATVVERAPALVIGDDDPDLPGASSYFLMRALAPHGGPGDRLRVRHLRGADVEAGQLADAVGVFLAAPAALTEDALHALADYLRRGGGVWCFAGNPGMEAIAERLERAMPGGCLPWKNGALRTTTGDGARRIASGDWQARLLQAFGPVQQESVARIPFLRVREAGETHAAARRLLTYDDGTPALAVRETQGGGRFYLANFALEREAGDLARNGFFVALLHRAVEELQRTLRQRERHYAGLPLAFVTARPFDAAAGAPCLVGPNGDVFSDALLRVNRQDLSVALPVATATGFYDVMQGDRLLGRAAVNLDPRESDLQRLEEPRLLAALRNTGAASAHLYAMRGDDERHGPAWRGTPLWGWAAVLALAALMSEMTLLGLWRR